MNAFGSEVKSAIASIIASEEFPIPPSIDVSSGSESGDGFASKNAVITITGNGKQIHIFIKYVPENTSDKQIKLFQPIFEAELRFYDAIFPVILKFQHEKEVKDAFDNVPKYYVAKIPQSRIPPIILSNLRTFGYTLRDIRETADDNHISLIMRTYAKFHATSFAMKDQQPHLYRTITDNIYDCFAEKFWDVGLGDTTILLIKNLTETLDKVADKTTIDKCTEFCENLDKFLLSIPGSVDKYSVLCHGDCWCNNMMFLYDKKTGIPIDLKLLDWQIYRVIPPGLEAAHAFYALAKKEALNNFDYYRTLYYDTLAGHIIKLGSDPEKLYPKEVFLDQWRKFGKFGLMLSFSINRVAFLSKDDITDLVDSEDGKMPVFSSDFKEKARYHRIMTDLINHFVDNEFL